jgi:hypothetical protein
MSAVGVLAPTTMLLMLHAEGVQAAVVAGLVPGTGMAGDIPVAIRMLHDTWGGDRLEMAALLGATAEELLRSAGCTPIDMLAAAA